MKTLRIFVLTVAALGAGAMLLCADQQVAARLQWRFENTLQFRREIDAAVNTTYTIAGDTREHRNHAVIELECGLKCGAPPAADAPVPVTLKFSSILLRPDADASDAAATVVSPDGIIMYRGEKQVRKAALKGTPYEGIGKWRVQRQCLSTGAAAQPEDVAEHEFFAELYRLYGLDMLALPKDAVAPGDTWQQEFPLFRVDSSDQLQQLDLRLIITYTYAGREERGGTSMARITYTGECRTAVDNALTYDDVATHYEFKNVRHSIQGECLFDPERGRPLRLTAALGWDYEFSKTPPGGVASHTHRHAQFNISQLAILPTETK